MGALFGDRVAVPTVAPTFAYLGVLVYAIYILAADYLGQGTAGADQSGVSFPIEVK